VKSQLLCSR